jgi:hypothetical protein
MRRTRTFLALLVGSLAVIVLLSPAASAQNRQIERKLDDTVVSFSFTDQPLQEALDFLGTLGGVNIVLDRRQAEDAQTVTLKLSNVTLRTALKFLTEQVELRWIVRDGLVFISDEEGTRQEPVTAVYEVGDLLVQPPDFEGPAIELQSLNRSSGTNSTDNPNPWGEKDDETKETDIAKTRDEMLQDLVELIQQVIEPGTWEDTTP